MISIVTAYHNRRDLLITTLKTLENSIVKDFEFILVDDCSSDEHRVEDLMDKYPFLRVVRLEKENKWYVNPCVVFNVGFNEAKGDIIILQNPECLHVGDVLERASQITKDEYISFGCYSIDNDKTIELGTLTNPSKEDLMCIIQPNPRTVGSDGDNGWYNHSKYRPMGYHFCSVIHKSNLDKLGGFDERYAHGIAYDDNEILIRIQRMGLKINIINDPFVVHQWHYSSNNYQHLDASKLINKNRELLNVTKSETTWKVNL
jgi:GT2 family glycosyltransferase